MKLRYWIIRNKQQRVSDNVIVKSKLICSGDVDETHRLKNPQREAGNPRELNGPWLEDPQTIQRMQTER